MTKSENERARQTGETDVAGGREVLAYLTAVLRGEAGRELQNATARMKAAELLARRTGALEEDERGAERVIIIDDVRPGGGVDACGGLPAGGAVPASGGARDAGAGASASGEGGSGPADGAAARGGDVPADVGGALAGDGGAGPAAGGVDACGGFPN